MSRVSFRAGVVLTSGTGLIRPIHSDWLWPLQEIVLNKTGIEARPPIILTLVDITKTQIEWHEVQKLT